MLLAALLFAELSELLAALLLSELLLAELLLAELLLAALLLEDDELNDEEEPTAEELFEDELFPLPKYTFMIFTVTAIIKNTTTAAIVALLSIASFVLPAFFW